jgi:hypothetical protein
VQEVHFLTDDEIILAQAAADEDGAKSRVEIKHPFHEKSSFDYRTSES